MKCEVIPIGLLARVVESFISNGGHLILSRRTFLSLTELTDLTEPFSALFRFHRTPPAYRYHRMLQLKVGVGCWVLGVDD